MPDMPVRSLRRRLLALLLGTTGLVLLAAGTIGYFAARHEADELLDAHLAQAASLILLQSAGRLEHGAAMHAPQLHRYSRRVAVQLWENGRVIRLSTDNAPNGRLSARDDGFSDVVHGRERWRVFSAWDRERRYLIQVGDRVRAREEITRALGLSLLLPVLAALPLLAVAVWLGVGRGLQPLDALRAQLAARGARGLAPVALAHAPEEVRPLADEMNRLFGRIEAAMERERRFTSDAAHELRTPLAGLLTQAQVARRATDDAQRAAALDRIIEGAERTARLLEQLLTLARLEAGQDAAGRSPVDLAEVARSVLAAHAPAAVEAGLEVALETAAPAIVEATPGLLEILLRNLLDNALRHSPAGGQVRVRVETADGMASLSVLDDGPGVPEADRAALGARFHRPADSPAGGSGLGLSIVLRIAELLGGSAAFSPGEGNRGFVVRVRLPVSVRPA